MRKWIGICVLDILLLVCSSPSALGVTLRFTYAPLNYAAFALMLGFLPVAVIAAGSKASGRLLTWLLCTAGFLLLLPALALSGIACLMLADVAWSGADDSSVKIAELKTASADFRAYRTDYGATTDFGVVLQRETPIMLGLSLVSVECAYYHAAAASLRRLSDARGVMTVGAYGNGYPQRICEFDI